MLPDLKQKMFLDIGCETGLSSLAAWDAGVPRLLSFNLDPLSVQTTERVRFGPNLIWTSLASDRPRVPR